MNYHTCSKHNYTGTNECPDCLRDFLEFAESKKATEKERILDLQSKFNAFMSTQKELPKEYTDIVNKNFWDLLK